MTVLLSKPKKNENVEFNTVYFNSTAEANVGFNKFGVDELFQKLLYGIDNWINKGSAWAIEKIDGEYISISNYNTLS